MMTGMGETQQGESRQALTVEPSALPPLTSYLILGGAAVLVLMLLFGGGNGEQEQ